MVNWLDQRQRAHEFFTDAVHEDDLVPSFAVSRALGVGNKRVGTLGIPRTKIGGVWCYRKRDVLAYLERSAADPVNPYFAYRQKIRARWDKLLREREARLLKRWPRPSGKTFPSTAAQAQWFAEQEALHRRWGGPEREAEYAALQDELFARFSRRQSAAWMDDAEVDAILRRLDELAVNRPEEEYWRELAERRSSA